MKLQIKTTSIKQNNGTKIANESSELCFILCSFHRNMRVYVLFRFFRSCYFVKESKKNFEEKLNCSKEQGKKNKTDCMDFFLIFY